MKPQLGGVGSPERTEQRGPCVGRVGPQSAGLQFSTSGCQTLVIQIPPPPAARERLAGLLDGTVRAPLRQGVLRSGRIPTARRAQGHRPTSSCLPCWSGIPTSCSVLITSGPLPPGSWGPCPRWPGHPVTRPLPSGRPALCTWRRVGGGRACGMTLTLPARPLGSTSLWPSTVSPAQCPAPASQTLPHPGLAEDAHLCRGPGEAGCPWGSLLAGDGAGCGVMSIQPGPQVQPWASKDQHLHSPVTHLGCKSRKPLFELTPMALVIWEGTRPPFPGSPVCRPLFPHARSPLPAALPLALARSPNPQERTSQHSGHMSRGGRGWP